MGEATAKMLAAEGASVIIASRSKEKLRRAAESNRSLPQATIKNQH